MSDHHPPAPDGAGPRSGPAGTSPPPPPLPPPPPPPPPAAGPPPGAFGPVTPTAAGEPLATYPSAQPARPPGGGSRLAAALVGVVLLVGGVGFAVARAGDGGPATPEAAVDALVGAIVDRDVIGVLEVMPAGERRALQDPLRDISDELVRLGVLDESFDLGGIAGVELSVDGLALATEQVHEGLAAVTIAGGTVTSTVTPDELPLGPQVRRWFEDDPYSPLDEPPTTSSEPLTTPEGDDLVLMAVRDGGGWRVSLGYTIAENIRIAEGLPRPDPAAAVVARGADSPEAAVEEVLRASADLDARRVIELLPPDEMGALQAYAPLFLDDLEAEAARARESYDLERLDLDLSTERSGDMARVRLERADLELTADGERYAVSFDGECLEYDEGYGLEELGCLSDLDELDVPVELDVDLLGVLAVTTVKVDGQWYVSPTRSILDGVTTGLRSLPDDAFEHLTELVEEVMWEVEESFGTVAESFEPPYSDGLSGSIGDIEDLPDHDLWYDDDDWDDWDHREDELPGVAPSTTVVPDPRNPVAPSPERLAETLRRQGFPGMVADCIAEEVHWMGLTDEELFGLERDDPDVWTRLSDDAIAQIDEITEYCESRGP